MTFYRNLTRQRTLNSILEFDTKDNGLRNSIFNFTTSPRVAKFFNCFEIREDYCANFDKDPRRPVSHPYVERSQSIRIPKPVIVHNTQNRKYHKETYIELEKHNQRKNNHCVAKMLSGEEKSYSQNNLDGAREQAILDSDSKSNYVDTYNNQDWMDDYLSQDSLNEAMKSSLGRGMITKTGSQEILKTLSQEQSLDVESEFEASLPSQEKDETYKTPYSERCHKSETISTYKEDLEGSFFSD